MLSYTAGMARLLLKRLIELISEWEINKLFYIILHFFCDIMPILILRYASRLNQFNISINIYIKGKTI